MSSAVPAEFQDVSCTHCFLYPPKKKSGIERLGERDDHRMFLILEMLDLNSFQRSTMLLCILCVSLHRLVENKVSLVLFQSY
ncbi:hypothetical protein C0J52_15365 [Blattella germanica]|nr:hypothetical protein C0J52_15365 [Blattella germanica]